MPKSERAGGWFSTARICSPRTWHALAGGFATKDAMQRLSAKVLLVVAVSAEMSPVGCGAGAKPAQTEITPPAGPNEADDVAEEHGQTPYHGELAITKAAEAERLLAAGNLREAALIAFNGHFYYPDSDIDSEIYLRMFLVRASISFRESEDSAGPLWAESVRKNISWLEFRLRDDPDNPVLIARLAEGYALDDQTRAQARQMLEDLARRNAMPDAFAFATLAHLRVLSGDLAAAEEAMRSCEKRAKRDDVVVADCAGLPHTHSRELRTWTGPQHGRKSLPENGD